MSAIEKLGASLTEAMRKIIKAPIIDEAVVKELIKEFQRALLQADVNVNLVLDLSNRIQERTLREKLPPGISRREHVVKVIHEELTKFVGKTPVKLRVEPGRPNVFMLIGIQGSGKCITGNSRVSLSNGQIKTIAELFEEHIGCCESAIILQDGIAIHPKNLTAYSINPGTLKIEEKSVEWIWKLKATEELYEVQLDYVTNLMVITTPEHPYFTIEKGIIKRVRASNLKKGQFVMTPLPFTEDLPRRPNFSFKEQKVKCKKFGDVEWAAKKLQTLHEIDVKWVKVRYVRKIKNHSIEYVYDLTVKDHHNFVANNIVVHNTTSAAKIARYFQKRGFKSALVCADLFRLGAFAQLRQ